MTHQDKISLMITFFVGVVVGGYIYLSGFATTFKLPEVGTQEQYTNMVVTGESFGACEADSTCLSFQILQDGSYQAIVGTDVAVRDYKGTISHRNRKTLNTTLTPANLEVMTKLKSDTVCDYVEEATNFEFTVTREGKNYSFDTCRFDIDYKSEAWKGLTEVWGEIAKASVK